jgi:hypothetical protein
MLCYAWFCRSIVYSTMTKVVFFLLFWKDTFGHPVESEEGYYEQDDLEDQNGDGDVGSVVHRYSTVHNTISYYLSRYFYN